MLASIHSQALHTKHLCNLVKRQHLDRCPNFESSVGAEFRQTQLKSKHRAFSRDRKVEMILLGEPFTLLSIGPNIWVIVITGGPCSGKTTGMACLKRWLEDRGFKVLIVPESATKLMTGGILPGELRGSAFQERVLIDTLAQEETFIAAAKMYRDQGRKVVVLCDRGTLDGEAYCGPKVFGSLLGRYGLSYMGLGEQRYHAAMHLRTAALGARAFYTLANNKERTETPREAIRIDEKTLQAWMKHHPHPRCIDNSTNFARKLKRLLQEICAVLGIPEPVEREDKFLIDVPKLSTFPVEWVRFSITQDYLVSPSAHEERRVRERVDRYGSSCFYYTVKRKLSSRARIENECIVAEVEGRILRTLRDPRRFTIYKDRIGFFWCEQFFELDIFKKRLKGLALLEREYTNKNRFRNLPSFVRVRRDVTEDDRYSNSNLARLKSLPQDMRS